MYHINLHGKCQLMTRILCEMRNSQRNAHQRANIPLNMSNYSNIRDGKSSVRSISFACMRTQAQAATEHVPRCFASHIFLICESPPFCNPKQLTELFAGSFAFFFAINIFFKYMQISFLAHKKISCKN